MERNRRNDTHTSLTDPESRLYRKGKGKEARLYFIGHVLMKNRNWFGRGHPRHPGERDG